MKEKNPKVATASPEIVVRETLEQGDWSLFDDKTRFGRCTMCRGVRLVHVFFLFKIGAKVKREILVCRRCRREAVLINDWVMEPARTTTGAT